MIHRFNTIRVLGLVIVFSAASAWAGPSEFASSAASKASAVTTKVEHAVKRGVHATASAVERGASATGRAVHRTAQKLGLPTTSGASSPSTP